MSQVVDAPLWRGERSAVTVPGRLARLLPAVGLVALLIATALLAANAAYVVRASLAAVGYPFELDFAEGLILAQTRARSAGGSLYPPAVEQPNTITNYAPIYYAVVTLLSGEPRTQLAAGRAVSLGSAILAAIALAVLTWHAIDPSARRLVRGLAAACAALAFLQISYTASFAALMRVDLLAILWAFSGILVFSRTAAHGRHVYWCLVPLLLALYTKQNTVAAAAACVLTAARADRRRGLALGAAFAAAAMVAAGALQLATHGGFAFHVVTGNINPFSWERAASFLQDLAIRYPISIALAAAVTPRLLTSLPRDGRAPTFDPASASGWTRAALGAYLPLVALTTLTVGKVGSEVNYLIELMGVVCAAAAVAVADALHVPAVPAAARPPLGAAAAAAVIPLLVLWQVARVAPAHSIEVVEGRSVEDQAKLARLVELVRQTEGSVLSEDLTLLVQADKPILFQPSDITLLMNGGLRDARPFLAALEERRFPLVVLRFDLRSPPPIAFERFSPAMIDAIDRHYAPLAVFPEHWVYAPRPPRAALTSTETAP